MDKPNIFPFEQKFPNYRVDSKICPGTRKHYFWNRDSFIETNDRDLYAHLISTIEERIHRLNLTFIIKIGLNV